MGRQRRPWHIVIGLVAAVAVIVLIDGQRTEIIAVVRTVRDAQMRWLLLSVVLQGGVYLSFAVVHWRSLWLLGYRLKLHVLYGIAFVAIFLGRVFPVGGAIPAAFLLYQFRRRGIPDGTGTVAIGLNGLSGVAAFVLLLLTGVVYLFVNGQFALEQLLLPGLIGLTIAALALYLWMLHHHRTLLTRRALLLKNLVRRLLHRSWDDRGVLVFISEIYESLDLIKQKRSAFLQLVALQVSALLLDALTVWLLLYALGGRPHLVVALLAYSLAYFLSMATTLPGGGGTFEATMILSFVQLGVATEIALGATLLYRLLAFWLPLSIAGPTYYRVQMHAEQHVPQNTPTDVQTSLSKHSTRDRERYP